MAVGVYLSLPNKLTHFVDFLFYFYVSVYFLEEILIMYLF